MLIVVVYVGLQLGGISLLVGMYFDYLGVQVVDFLFFFLGSKFGYYVVEGQYCVYQFDFIVGFVQLLQCVGSGVYDQCLQCVKKMNQYVYGLLFLMVLVVCFIMCMQLGNSWWIRMLDRLVRGSCGVFVSVGQMDVVIVMIYVVMIVQVMIVMVRVVQCVVVCSSW